MNSGGSAAAAQILLAHPTQKGANTRGAAAGINARSTATGRTRARPGSAATLPATSRVENSRTPQNAFLRIIRSKMDAGQARVSRFSKDTGVESASGGKTHAKGRAELRCGDVLPEELSLDLSTDSLSKEEKTAGKRKSARGKLPSSNERMDLGTLTAESLKKTAQQPAGKNADSSAEAARPGAKESAEYRWSKESAEYRWSDERAENRRGAEARPGATARGAETRVFVLDLRKRNAEQASGEAEASGRTARISAVGKDSVELAARASPDQGPRIGAFRKPEAAYTAQFASALERLREMAGPELVRTAGIILRNGGDGEIRLVLKPDSLGSVRIRLNLVDNAIEGRIVVDNAAVKQAFDSSMDALTRALTAEGFQTASLEVSVGGQAAEHDGASRETPSIASARMREDFDGNVPGLENMDLGDMLVNLFA